MADTGALLWSGAHPHAGRLVCGRRSLAGALAWLALGLCSLGFVSLAPLAGAQVQPQPHQPAPSVADAGRSAPQWRQLSPAEQSALAPLASAWDSQPAVSRQKWVALAQRMQAMGAGERARIQQRMQAWASLPPQERAQARQQFQEAQKSSSALDRQQHWAHFQSLAPEQRQQLSQRAQERQAPHSLPIRLRPSVVNPPGTPDGALPEAKRAQPASVALKRPPLGATTTLASQLPNPPSHHKPGQPKVAGSAEFVDSRTLLPLNTPRSGPPSTRGVAPGGNSGAAGAGAPASATVVAPGLAPGLAPGPAPGPMPGAAGPSPGGTLPANPTATHPAPSVPLPAATGASAP
jgi:hypothetical protein